MKKLISMTDFVRKSFEKVKKTDKEILFEYISICRYQEFLKQPLTLGMFVACDDDCNVLEDPIEEKVLFDGFYNIEAINYHISRNRNIEYLANLGSIELTENATKQFL